MSEQDPSAETKNSWFQELKNLLLIEPNSAEQLIQILKNACAKNLLDAGTLNMIEGVLQISKMQVKDIMVPRSQMVSLEHDQTMPALLKAITRASHSRFPVLGDTQDDIIGIVLVKDFLKAYTDPNKKDFALKDILRPAYFVPESKRLDSLLNEFKANRNHLAIVVDEYGGIAGLVTIEDILEEIVGDIEDEFDPVSENKILKLDDRHYQVHALVHLDELNEALGTHFEDPEGNIDTIGGLVILTLGHVPSAGAKIHIDNWEITVTKANERRVLQVELKKL